MPRPPSKAPRIVILGGGFAGLAAALELQSGRYDVTLVDRSRHFEFLPNIHELLSGVKSPELLRLPLERSLRRAGHRFARERVTRIDPVRKRVETRPGHSLSYDALIVALGGVDQTRGVEGVSEHALPFKSAEQCARIGRRLEQGAAQRRPGPVVIVGGGLEGVEALGEILRRYRDSGLQLSLVEASDRLLPETPACLDAHLRDLCSALPVDLRLESRVARIESDRVVLENGDTLPSELTIWTGGPTAPELLAASGLAPPGAWAPVDVTLQSKHHPEVFVAGDAAETPTPLTKQAYHALDMGVCAARNAARFLSDREPRRFRPSGKPTLISFGDLSCFLVAGERVLAGAALGAAKEAVFELVMTQLDSAPLLQRLPRVLRRVDRASRELLWPNLTSLEALRRQARVSLLSSG